MQTFARDSLVFDVRDEGPEDGDVVALLHGFPQDSTCWDELVSPLHQAGYRTLAPDQRGYSPRAMPKGASSYRQAELVHDVAAMLDAAGVADAHIVGHDWGGSVAWSFASVLPERTKSLTSLSTPHPGAFGSVALKSSQAIKSWYMGLFQVPKVSEAILRPGGPAWRALTTGLPAHQAEHYAEHMRTAGALTAGLNWYRALPRDVIRPSAKARRIEVPTLYLWGERDPSLGRAAAVATEDFVVGDYTFEILEGIGHWVPETGAEVVLANLLPFLKRFG